MGDERCRRQQGHGGARLQGVDPGWLLDREGRPTTIPPTTGPAGRSCRPAAQGYKGTGLSFTVETLAAILPGLGFGVDPEGRHNDGAFLLASRPGSLPRLAQFKAEVAAFARYVKATLACRGQRGVVLGEIEHRDYGAPSPRGHSHRGRDLEPARWSARPAWIFSSERPKEAVVSDRSVYTARRVANAETRAGSPDHAVLVEAGRITGVVPARELPRDAAGTHRVHELGDVSLLLAWSTSTRTSTARPRPTPTAWSPPSPTTGCCSAPRKTCARAPGAGSPRCATWEPQRDRLSATRSGPG